MLDNGMFWIISGSMLVIGVIANIVAFILEKRYKNKMNKMAELKKAEK